MKWFSLKDIKNYSVYFTPNLPILETKRYKLSLFRMGAYILLYTIASWLVLILLLSATPLKDMLFYVDNGELQAQNKRIEKLQNRVILLTQELQTLSSTNERIKYAIKLGEKDTLDKKNPLYDTLQKTIRKKIQVEGNALEAFIMFYNNYFQEKNPEIKKIFLEPTNGIIIQDFLPEEGHMGIDYGVKVNTPVYATTGGIVTFADFTTEDGYMIIIQHEGKYMSVYKHCSTLLKKSRDIVEQGMTIALSGNRGRSSGPHLHFEIWYDGKQINPQKVLLK